MIVDDLNNIEIYKNFSAEIYSSLQLLSTLEPDIALGARPINSRVGNRTFAVMFENDGHSPKHCVDLPQLIKKVTFKVLIS